MTYFYAMRLIARIISTSIAVLLVTKLMPHVSVDNAWTAIMLSIILSLLNVFVKPVLIFFTLPITVFTLGFFLLVINAAIVLMASQIVHGFKIDGFWWAMLFSIVLSLVVSVFERLQGSPNREDDRDRY
jgi:putative membrane protein